MISFTIITDTPARLRDFLISREVLQDVNGRLVGTLPGMEWVKVPNPIITTPAVGLPKLPDGTPNPDYVPPVYDDRAVFLVKFAWDSENEKAQGFRTWLINNTTVVAAPAEWTINGLPVGNARKVDNELVWLVHLNPERFGVWQ